MLVVVRFGGYHHQLVIVAEGTAAHRYVSGADRHAVHVVQYAQLVGFRFAQGDLVDRAGAAVQRGDLLRRLGGVVRAHEVENIRAGVALKGAAVNIGLPAEVLSGFLVYSKAVVIAVQRHGDLHNGVARVGRGAVPLKGAAVADERALSAKMHRRAQYGFGHAGAVVRADHVLDAVHKVEYAVGDLADGALVEHAFGHVLARLRHLRVFLFCGALAVTLPGAVGLFPYGFGAGAFARSGIRQRLCGRAGAVFLFCGGNGIGQTVVVRVIHGRLILEARHKVVLGGNGHIDAGGEGGNVHAQLHSLPNGVFELAPREILFHLGLLPPGLIGAAVGDERALGHPEQVARGVYLDIVLEGINHAARAGDIAGAGGVPLRALFVGAPAGGVHDDQRGAVCDLKKMVAVVSDAL